MIVERTDYISVPVTEMERSKAFYRDALGLDLIDDRGFPEFQLGANISLYLIDMTSIGSEFTGPHTSSIALRVPDVKEARAELEGKGIAFAGETHETPVCHMAFFTDPDGNSLMLHRRFDAVTA